MLNHGRVPLREHPVQLLLVLRDERLLQYRGQRGATVLRYLLLQECRARARLPRIAGRFEVVDVEQRTDCARLPLPLPLVLIASHHIVLVLPRLLALLSPLALRQTRQEDLFQNRGLTTLVLLCITAIFSFAFFGITDFIDDINVYLHHLQRIAVHSLQFSVIHNLRIQQLMARLLRRDNRIDSLHLRLLTAILALLAHLSQEHKLLPLRDRCHKVRAEHHPAAGDIVYLVRALNIKYFWWLQNPLHLLLIDLGHLPENTLSTARARQERLLLVCHAVRFVLNKTDIRNALSMALELRHDFIC